MPSVAINLPVTQTAIVAVGPGKLAIKYDAPVPSLAPDIAIVKTAAVAINPADAKMLDYSAAPGAIHGYDFAGTIVALGAETPAHLSVGDRVAGFVHGMNSLQPNIGAFAQYVGASADLLLKIPDGMRIEDAAGLGTGVGTAALALFRELKIPVSPEQFENGPAAPQSGAAFVLVCGGSTATGTRAIQIVKLYVHTTPASHRASCSPAQHSTLTNTRLWQRRSSSNRDLFAAELRSCSSLRRRGSI